MVPVAADPGRDKTSALADFGTPATTTAKLAPRLRLVGASPGGLEDMATLAKRRRKALTCLCLVWASPETAETPRIHGAELCRKSSDARRWAPVPGDTGVTILFKAKNTLHSPRFMSEFNVNA